MKYHFNKYSSSKTASKGAKLHYQNTCIITGGISTEIVLVGAHIVAAGSCPELKCYRENILPMAARAHTTGNNTFDWIGFGKKERSLPGKILWLRAAVIDELKPKVLEQLYELIELARLKGLNQIANQIETAI